MGFLAPKPPKIPTPLPPPSPEELEAQARDKAREQRRKIRASQVDTILTGGQGLGANQQTRTLLGGA